MAGKLSQPGCHSNTGTSSRSGRSLVKLEVIIPDNNRMRGSTRGKVQKKAIKTGKKFLGRQWSFLQFSSKPANFMFNTENERIETLLKRFRTLWVGNRNSFEVLVQMKDRYPYLANRHFRVREGHVPGVAVGDCFRCRAELCLVGLHRHLQAGIDWIDAPTGSIAISVVVSGGYEDDVDEGETLTYTGEGGNDMNTKKQYADQKLEGGNLALWNSHFMHNSVRVIRGRPDSTSPSGTVYSYDGLYKLVDRRKQGISNFQVYKFTLVREQGQKPLRWHFPVNSPRKAKWSDRGSQLWTPDR